MSSYFKITLLAAALASSALAKQNAPSPACTTAPDTACNYSYQTVDANSNPITVFVDAFCGPIRTDGLSYCGDNGKAAAREARYVHVTDSSVVRRALQF